MEKIKLNYRVVETNDGFKIQKERLVNIGFILFPNYIKLWTDLNLHKGYCWEEESPHYYKTADEAINEVQRLENPIHKVVYETK